MKNTTIRKCPNCKARVGRVDVCPECDYSMDLKRRLLPHEDDTEHSGVSMTHAETAAQRAAERIMTLCFDSEEMPTSEQVRDVILEETALSELYSVTYRTVRERALYERALSAIEKVKGDDA